jgi:hypothetical protein
LSNHELTRVKKNLFAIRKLVTIYIKFCNYSNLVSNILCEDWDCSCNCMNLLLRVRDDRGSSESIAWSQQVRQEYHSLCNCPSPSVHLPPCPLTESQDQLKYETGHTGQQLLPLGGVYSVGWCLLLQGMMMDEQVRVNLDTLCVWWSPCHKGHAVDWGPQGLAWGTWHSDDVKLLMEWLIEYMMAWTGAALLQVCSNNTCWRSGPPPRLWLWLFNSETLRSTTCLALLLKLCMLLLFASNSSLSMLPCYSKHTHSYYINVHCFDMFRKGEIN